MRLCEGGREEERSREEMRGEVRCGTGRGGVVQRSVVVWCQWRS